MAALDLFDDEPADHGGGGGEVGVDECLGGDAVGAERGAGIESEPAEPQDAGAEQSERQVVGRHRLAGPASALPEHEGKDERGHAGVDVDDGTTGEVEGAELEEPAFGAEHPVGDRRVDEDRPSAEEHHVGAELEAVGGRPGEERGAMMANIIWKAKNASGGIVNARSPA